MKLCMGCMEQIEDSAAQCPYCGFNERTTRQESYYLDPGTVVGGKYIVGRALNYGGYTITYIGYDAENERKVTVKEYLPSDFSTRSEGEKEVTIYSGDALEQFEQGLTNFLNEANKIQQLSSVDVPGIAKVYDCVAENDTGYVISEYLQGVTLQEMLDKGKTFTPEEAKELLSQILDGLSQVHPLDVIHCDIAPENILITETGDVKLLDFGATRYVTTANSKSLAIILKQGYAPEEQYRSRGVRGPWTDVYALAAVMYRMITGKVPDESVDRALQDQLQEPSKLGIQIPENMENALMNALNVYQQDRTQSAQVFLKELNSLQVKRIQVKRRKNETGKFPKWAKGLVAGLLCVVLAGGGFVLYNVNRQDVDQGGNTNSIAPDLANLSLEDATKKLGKVSCEVSEFTYVSTAGGSFVLEQEPAAGSVIEENKVSFVIKTSEKCHYSDILANSGNVYALADYLNLESSVCVESQDDSEDKELYNLYSIQLKDGTILDYNTLKAGEKKELEISQIKNISYYISPFLYKSPMKNYVGKNISNVKFDKMKIKNGKKTKIGEETPNAKKTYYSFSQNYPEGYIVSQKKKYSEGSEYSSYSDTATIFDVVKQVISWKGKSGSQLSSTLKSLGVTDIQFASGCEASDPVIGVTASNTGAYNQDVFTNASTIVIRTQPVATPTPKPTEPPVVSNPTSEPVTKPNSENDTEQLID